MRTPPGTLALRGSSNSVWVAAQAVATTVLAAMT
jgi:hypothetical protein